MTANGVRRIVIHAGFHKTGTSALQDTIAQNRALISPHVECFLPEDLTYLSRAVKRFSSERNKLSKFMISQEAEAFFADLDMSDPRPIFLSHENLAGKFVGSPGVFRYAAAPIAMELIREAWLKMTGRPDGQAEEFEVYYSTRRDGWPASVHWQLVLHAKLTLSFEEFREKYADAADLAAIVSQARTRLAPSVVHAMALEDMGHPIKPFLRLFGLDALFDQLDLPVNRNRSLDEAWRSRMLEANRAKLSGKPLWDLRRAANQQMREGG